ncbi:MAG: type II toxin-antitoxin system RatA family toxin, partial [Hyphomicrobium sp.]|nr:type II toxin-antitoxin system RatA family toxin [Hyphomicrobium sp.]
MFDLVADVERYPEFLPLCESLVIRSRDDTGTDTVLVATMGIGYKAIRERFTTRVTLQPGQHTILVEYLDGPFRRLENRWRF